MKQVVVALLLALVLLCSSAVYAADLHGAIYDKDLNPIRKTVVHINSSPSQRHISQYGGYSFSVNPGKYVITANLTLNNITRTIAEQEVVITKDGDYRIDLFVFDDINISEGFEDEPPFAFESWFWLVIGIAIVLFAVLLFLMIKHQRVVSELQKEKPKPVVVEEKKSAKVEDSAVDPLERRILQLLKENDGKLSQKEIRKAVKYSQAKVSMMITTLEEQGKVEKIKSGRTNVISLVDTK